METTEKKITHTIEDVQNCIDFIAEYSKLEKKSYIYFRSYLENEWENFEKVDYITKIWRNKKKSFGDLWFKLDTISRIKMIRLLGVDPHTEEFEAEYAHNSMVALFKHPSNTYLRINNVLTFFENHGISERVETYLTLTDVPVFNGSSFDSKNLGYGTCTNWGRWILQQSHTEQLRIILSILDNYQIKNYQ